MTTLDQPSLAVLDVDVLEGVSDVHSMTAGGVYLYLVSTGTDEVRRVPLSSPGDRSEVVWKASTAGSDTHHVNAIVAADGRLLCSAFGPKAGQRWSTALDGYVVDIGADEIIARGIEHPHSLAMAPDDLYVAESRRARVRGIGQGRSFSVDGYARGLCVLPDGFVVGVSMGRSRSRSLGTIENAADPGEHAGDMGLSLFRRTEQSIEPLPIETIDLSLHGPEIYDVLAL